MKHRKIKIKIIYPKFSHEIFSEHYFMQKLFSSRFKKTRFSPLLMMPAALPTIAALTPDDFDIELIDENIEDIDFNDHADIVGLSTFSVMANRAYEIAEKFKKNGAYIVIGGIHASVATSETEEHADTVIVGEAEDIWPEFLNDFKNNKPKKKYECTQKPDMKKEVIPRWDKIKHSNYISYIVQTTRGCAFDCDFCCVRKFFGRPRHKPVENVIKEIKALKKEVRSPWPLYISFGDDNIVSSRRRAKELFRALKPLGIRWWGQASINVANDEELLQLAKESGCDSLLIGFESLSQAGQEEISKGKVNKVTDFKKAVAKLQEYNITLYPSFIFGLDDDETSVFEETRSFIQETGMEFPMLNTMTPWAGTRLHKRMEKDGRLRPVPWEDLNSFCVYFKPERMTELELFDGHRNTIFKLYSAEAILERIKISYQKGGMKYKDASTTLRLLVFTLLLKELIVQDMEMKKLIFEAIKFSLPRKDIKIELILTLLDRFVFARHLQKKFESERQQYVT